jgi:hypothetical protein
MKQIALAVLVAVAIVAVVAVYRGPSPVGAMMQRPAPKR